MGLGLLDLEETLELLTLLGNAVLAVLRVDRAETLPPSKLLHHATLQWVFGESSERVDNGPRVLTLSTSSHRKSNVGDQNLDAGTANSAGAMTMEETSSKLSNSSAISNLSGIANGAIGTQESKLGGTSRAQSSFCRGRNVELVMRVSNSISCRVDIRHFNNAVAIARSRLGSVNEKSDIISAMQVLPLHARRSRQ